MTDITDWVPQADDRTLHVKCDETITSLGRWKDELIGELQGVRALLASERLAKQKILDVIRQQFIDNEVDPYDGNVEELVKLGMKPLTRDITVRVAFSGYVEFQFEEVSCGIDKHQFEREINDLLDLDPEWEEAARVLSHATDHGCSVTDRYIEKGRITTEEIT